MRNFDCTQHLATFDPATKTLAYLNSDNVPYSRVPRTIPTVIADYENTINLTDALRNRRTRKSAIAEKASTRKLDDYRIAAAKNECSITRASRAMHRMLRRISEKDIKAFLIALLIGIAVFAGVSFHNNSETALAEQIKSYPTATVTVRAGDTIDGIAGMCGIEGVSDHFLGKVISDMNDIGGAIQPGQVLVVPTAKTVQS